MTHHLVEVPGVARPVRRVHASGSAPTLVEVASAFGLPVERCAGALSLGQCGTDVRVPCPRCAP